MNRTLDITEGEIFTKVIIRRRLLLKANAEILADQQEKLDTYIRDYMNANGMSLELLADKTDRDLILKIAGRGFVYQPTQDMVDRVNSLKAQAAAELPDTIKTEEWTPDTCKCYLARVYDTADAKGTAQTYFAAPCPEHAGLSSIEEIHDNCQKENDTKNQMFRVLLGYDEVKGLDLHETKQDGSIDLKDGVGYSWRYEGTGKDRVLKVEVKGASLTAKQKSDVAALCETKFGAGKVELL